MIFYSHSIVAGGLLEMSIVPSLDRESKKLHSDFRERLLVAASGMPRCRAVIESC